MRRESEDSGFSRKLVREVKKYPCLYNFNVSDYSRRDSTYAAWEAIASELNDTVFNCKDAWRNLRIVFTRHMKRQMAGLCKTKYYLMEDLRFLIPFLNPRKNIFPINELTSFCSENQDESFHDEINDSVNDLVDSTRDIVTVCDDSTSDVFDEARPIKKRKNTHKGVSASTFDSTEIEPNKNAKTNTDEEDNSLKYKRFIQSDDEISCDEKQLTEKKCKKMFLLSLFPDLDEMNHSQFRRFRSRVVQLIDDIFDNTNSIQADEIGNDVKIEFEEGP